MFEKCLEELRNEPLEQKKFTVEGATLEKGMRDTRKDTKAK
jgi:hypothetical protein